MIRRNSYRDEPRRDKLYRDGEAGMIAGVCAGLADFFGFDLSLTRVVVLIGTLVFPTLFFVYVILAILTPKKPVSGLADDTRDPYLEKKIKAEPHSTLRSVRHRFKSLDHRLQRLEKYVTSHRFDLDREFDGLKD